MDGWMNVLERADSWLWSYCLVVLLAVTGGYLTWRLRGVQFRALGAALKMAFCRGKSSGVGDVSHFQSLMVALAATIGMGNIAGVATAVAVGGLGALFWMWMLALLGMATKYSEAILAVKYRTINCDGQVSGGPMYYLRRGLGWKKMALFFAFFGALTALGTGNLVQANSVAEALEHGFGVDRLTSGLLLLGLVAAVVLGGIRWIGRVSAIVVPVMALLYIGMGVGVLCIHLDRIPEAVGLIIQSAFSGQAALGGFVGSTFWMALQYGAARGIFSNESGLGSAPIAAAAARTDMPARQGLVSMTGTFLDTIVVCSVTGLVIAVTQVLGQTGADGAAISGVTMTMQAFSVIPLGMPLLTLAIFLFAYSTILGWAYYGEKCIEYLAGTRWVRPYRLLFVAVVLPGSLLSLKLVWTLADITNGLMALPNLLGLLALSGVVVHETRLFQRHLREERQTGKLPQEVVDEPVTEVVAVARRAR
jgi:alanine or glycine:cation symporter, AGCS family